MPSITIKGISEDTLKLIRKKAASNSRSINKEIIELLNQYVKSKPLDIKQMVRSLDKIRPLFKGSLSSKSIQDSIRKGRP